MSPEHRPTPCHCINLREASRKITNLYDDALAASGLKVTQYSLLIRIKRLGSPSLQDLADDTDLDRSTLGRNVRILAKSGFVEIVVDRKDKRLSRISLTEHGAASLKRARSGWEACQMRIESALGPQIHEQLTTMITALDRLKPNDAAMDTSRKLPNER